MTSIQIDLATFLGTPAGRLAAETMGQPLVEDIFNRGVQSAFHMMIDYENGEIAVCSNCGTEYNSGESCADPDCRGKAFEAAEFRKNELQN